MSGHSKWATIRRKKEKTDAARGKIFTKLIKEISVAARTGGGDETGNPRLRTAVLAAKAANMPASNIERAIKKGTGELPGTVYEEVVYEGYGPGGAALLINTVTDNRNRTVSEIRHLLSKRGGSMGETGSVNWMFERRGYLTISAEATNEDDLLELLLDYGVHDIRLEEGGLFMKMHEPAENGVDPPSVDRQGTGTVRARLPELVFEQGVRHGLGAHEFGPEGGIFLEGLGPNIRRAHSDQYDGC